MNIKLRLSSKYAETILFGFIWLLFFLSPLFITSETDSFNWNHLFQVWIRFSPFVVFSVINHFFLIPFIFHKQKLIYFSSVIVLLVVLSFTLSELKGSDNRKSEIIGTRFAREHNPTPEDRPLPPPEFRMNPNPNQRGLRPIRQQDLPGALPPWVNSLVTAILVIGFDIGLRTTFKWNKLEKERELADKERVKSELAFLRNQLSPHFFMNTLNNIHALIDMDRAEAKESVIRLSKLMRHLLYESEKETISLEKEIGFIQSYVDLMKLRFTEKVKVHFAVNSEVKNIQVPPLLFTSLIENAFKYGVSYQHDSFIDIQLETAANKLKFNIRNSKSDSPNRDESTSGIGLENTRKRLDLIYQTSYRMEINETADTFSVYLELPL